MENFLAKLKPDTKVNIGVSVSPNVGVEMIMVDPATHKIMKYARRDLSYNSSTREIEDYGEFKQALSDLFNEIKIAPQNANVVVNMPSVCFGHSFLPTVLDDEGVTTALTSEIEQNYLFKKNVPVVSWVEVKENNSTEKRYILYSAMQEGVVDVIKQIFTDLGATLIAIENTYSSLMKTLEYTEITKDFAASSGSWNILLVSQNSYAVFSLLGYSVIEYFEEPLAIRSFNNDEVYVAISQAASAVLEKYPTDKLLIISESNDVSAEILAMHLKQPGDVIFLECNQYAKSQIMDVDLNVLPHYIKAITPEAIGAAIYRFKDYRLKLNFLVTADYQAPDTIRVMGFDLTKEQLTIYSLIIGGLFILVGFLCSTIVGNYASQLEEKSSSLSNETTTLQKELTDLQSKGNKIDIYSAAKEIDQSMVDKILYYNSIGADIPAKVWLTVFYGDSNGAYGIKGETTSVDEVYLFFRNLKAQVPKSDLFLSKLSVDDQEGLIDIEKNPNASYTFELTNNKFSSVKIKDPNTEEDSSAKDKKGKKKPSSTSNPGKVGSGDLPDIPDLPGA